MTDKVDISNKSSKEKADYIRNNFNPSQHTSYAQYMWNRKTDEWKEMISKKMDKLLESK